MIKNSPARWLQRVLSLRGLPSWISFHFRLLNLRWRTGKPAIFIYRPGGLGDVICCLPLCEAVHLQHPDANLIFLTLPAFFPVLRDNSHLTAAWPAPTKFRPKFILQNPWLVRQIICPLTPEEGGDPAVASWHIIDIFTHCAGLEKKSWPSLYFTSAGQQKIRHRLGFKEGPLKILLHTGRTWRVREWGFDKWQQIVHQLHRDYSAQIFHLCSSHRSIGDTRESVDLPETQLLPTDFNVEDTMALVSSVDLVIGIDSGILHLAGALKIPHVGLFGPVNPAQRLNPESPSCGVYMPLPCIFCAHKIPPTHWKDGCPFDIACMQQLMPEKVWTAVTEMLATQKKPNA